MSIWTVVVAFGLGFVVIACGTSDKKRAQCEKMRTAVNEAGNTVLAAPRIEGDPEGIARTANEQAHAMDEAKAILEAAKISDGTLSGYQRELATIAGKKVVVVKAMATAGEKDDQAAYETAAQQADALNDEENAITAKVISYCER